MFVNHYYLHIDNTLFKCDICSKQFRQSGKLKKHKHTRHAAISIYDGKEHDQFATDTPCTYAVQFTILHGRLNMSVVMRSNDLWYGFCNDQYQFSMLQKMIADSLKIDSGTYYHFVHNIHLYNDKID